MWERMGTSCAPSLQAMARVCQCSCLDFSCLKVNDLTTKEFCQVLTISLFFQPVQSLLWCRYSQLKVNCWLSVVVTAFLVVKLYLSSLSDRRSGNVIALQTVAPEKGNTSLKSSENQSKLWKSAIQNSPKNTKFAIMRNPCHSSSIHPPWARWRTCFTLYWLPQVVGQQMQNTQIKKYCWKKLTIPCLKWTTVLAVPGQQL